MRRGPVRPAERPPMAYRFAASVLRPAMVALTRQDWSGAEYLPAEGGFLVVTHHVSYIDPLVIAHFLNDNGHPPHFLAKSEVFEVPAVGSILRGAGQIPVYRETGQATDAYRAAVRAVEQGQCVVIYPEGTITRDPGLWPMRGKTGATRVALQTRCPVIPVAHWGVQEILGPYERRPRLGRRATMHVRGGPAIDLSDLYDKPLTRDTLGSATARIMQAITRELEQLRDEPAPAERYDPRAHGQPPIGRPRPPKEQP